MPAAAALLIASCDTYETVEPDEREGSQVTITLEGAEEPSRAAFGATAAAEAWEKALSSLSVFVFDNAGTLILRRDFTSGELTARSATFALPKSTANTSCSFYAVANYDASPARTKAALLALVEKAAASYNGTYAQVSAGAKRQEGFVMSGWVTKTVGTANSATQIGITLKRTVAKVALQASIDPAFTQKYSGSLTFNSVKLSKAASQSTLIAGSTPQPGAMTFTHTQTPASAEGKSDAVFYIFENGPLAAGSRVLLEIDATYDLDGQTSTTDDRSDVTYAVELSGKAAGEILRNGYYRIAANITGLAGQDCAVAITVADWETPITQTVDLGA